MSSDEIRMDGELREALGGLSWDQILARVAEARAKVGGGVQITVRLTLDGSHLSAHVERDGVQLLQRDQEIGEGQSREVIREALTLALNQMVNAIGARLLLAAEYEVQP